MRKLTERDVEFTVKCLPEDIPVEGNASAIDDATDAEIVKDIYDQLERGNQWAWCTVKVTAKWREFEGTDYLGGCSYKSEKDFTQPGGYYDDMKLEALADLNAKLIQIENSLKELA